MRLEEAIDHLEEMLADENHEWSCEECGALHSDDYPFCHMCGADMRGREGG